MNPCGREAFPVAGRAWGWIAIGCLLAAGCGKDDFMATHPAGGTAQFQGQPMRFARVTLFPVSKEEPFKTVVPSGEVGEDGTYRLTTYRFNDGAPTGEYKLTIIWPSGPESQSESAGFVADRLRGKYADPKTSSIPITIKSGENTLPPIDLR